MQLLGKVGKRRLYDRYYHSQALSLSDLYFLGNELNISDHLRSVLN